MNSSYRVLPADQWPVLSWWSAKSTIAITVCISNLDLLQFDVQSFKVMMDDTGAGLAR